MWILIPSICLLFPFYLQLYDWPLTFECPRSPTSATFWENLSVKDCTAQAKPHLLIKLKQSNCSHSFQTFSPSRPATLPAIPTCRRWWRRKKNSISTLLQTPFSTPHPNFIFPLTLLSGFQPSSTSEDSGLLHQPEPVSHLCSYSALPSSTPHPPLKLFLQPSAIIPRMKKAAAEARNYKNPSYSWSLL